MMLVAAGLMLSACGNKQQSDGKSVKSDNKEATAANEPEVVGDGPSRGIDAIRKTWRGKTLQVDADKSKAGIKEFALAFCKTYPQCGTNEALRSYLTSANADKDQGSIESKDGEHMFNYQIYCNPRNGYIHCMGEIETNRFTYGCFWNRKNGHKLFAAFMEECWESPDWEQCLVVFYDYDPATGVLTPEPALTDMIEQVAKAHTCYTVTLPEIGKDVDVTVIDGQEEDACADETLKLKWNGMTFQWEE